jgi:hypothetical protein
MKTSLRRFAACALLLAAACATQAHQIWFQQEGKALVFRYGELDVNMHEVSPGGLDRFGKLTATWIARSGEKPLPLAKQESGFAVPAVAGKGESFVAIDLSYPMFDTKRDGKVLRTFWVPATRWVSDFSAREPKLPLDIVPTGVVQGDTVEFRVVLRGEPLAGQKVNVAVPSGWIKVATSDMDGKFRFTLPWRGTYVVGLYYTEESSGERTGDKGAEPYQLQGWNSALSFHKPRGVAPFPVADKTLPASVLADMARAKAAAEEAKK